MAQEKYKEAIDFILYENTKAVDGEIWIWTPEKLERAVNTYGMPWDTKEEYEAEYGDEFSDLKVSSLFHSPNSKELLDKISFEFDYYTVSEENAKVREITNTDYENHMTLCFQELHVV